jgi:hypothetical protein
MIIKKKKFGQHWYILVLCMQMVWGLTFCVNVNIEHEMCKYKFKNKYVYMILCSCVK